jgi:TM2 domain-containing membrane protein YozV
MTEPTNPLGDPPPPPAAYPPPAHPAQPYAQPSAQPPAQPIYDQPVSYPPTVDYNPQPVNYPPVSSGPGYPPVSSAPASYPPGYQGQPYQTQGYPPPPGYPAQGYPAAGYGAIMPAVDPLTGRPMSDKSKMIAGLLQLLPAIFFSFGGIGRLYAGNTTLGVVQIAASVVGWISFLCGFVLVLPFFITAAVWVWMVVDGIVMLAGRPVDGQGRLLRS